MYAIILAGGVGERFWPLSRREHPKQFLSLFEEKSLLQLAVDRLEGLVEPENVYVVTGESYREMVREQLPQLQWENIIYEPYGRDTAAAVGLAAEFVSHRDPLGVMAVLPADHYITDEADFKQKLRVGSEVAKDGKSIIALGIKPSRPETGYGYIQQGERIMEIEDVPIFHAVAFHEKPGIIKAKEYLSADNYLWNSGIFIWRVDLIRKNMATFLPQLAAGLDVIARSIGTKDEYQVIKEIYQKLPRISIDYGIMEKSDQVLVIPVDFGWDDVGSWTALEHYHKVDQHGNVVNTRGVFLDTQNCLIYSPHRVVATLGVEDLLIVDGGDCLLVSRKDRAQDIKRIVEGLKDAGYDDLI